ncbi:MAG: DUF1156 domain-containing protein, partial [Gemmatales bacterium]|nr:DUF1156 domain-containing protein [Gemmatales bacterium]MDW8174961.1 DUF1156 domain-containing protein [Gemmatales bacterium]
MTPAQERGRRQVYAGLVGGSRVRDGRGPRREEHDWRAEECGKRLSRDLPARYNIEKARVAALRGQRRRHHAGLARCGELRRGGSRAGEVRMAERLLIESVLPIRALSEQARREKAIRHGHISTLHVWWARRPLVVARAAVLG